MKYKEINLDYLKDIILKVGQEVLKIYHSNNIQKFSKIDQSPLSNADIKSHDLLTQFLFSQFPNIPILSEESIQEFKLNNVNDAFWCIDPVDGTKEFLNKNDEFTINIALIEKCSCTIGLIYAPAINTLYFAKKGFGAYEQKDKKISQIRIKNFNKNDIKFVVSRSHLSEQTDRFIKKFTNSTVLRMGSALKLCLVASGEVDCYPRFGPTSFWDIAAGHLLITEAGGVLTDTSYREVKYDINYGYINANFYAKNSLPLNKYLDD